MYLVFVSITMTYTIIDFNVTATCDMILASAKRPTCYYIKPIFGIVRDMGSGKTRCLEEIRRELLKRPGVLPIGGTIATGGGRGRCSNRLIGLGYRKDGLCVI